MQQHCSDSSPRTASCDSDYSRGGGQFHVGWVHWRTFYGWRIQRIDMVQCEMCGVETETPKTAKIEGAELQVCDDCVEFGTEITTTAGGSSTTKYSTTESSDAATTQRSNQRSRGSRQSRSGSRRDFFDEMKEVVSDYHERIREAREGMGVTQAELADQLNEKTSLIRKLERGDHLPSDAVRKKLEGALDIDLLEGGPGEDDAGEWSSQGESGGVTLGDIVKRKD